MSAMLEPLMLSEIPPLVKALTGVSVSRQTVYNWKTTGRRALSDPERIVRLQTVVRAGRVFTTREWVQDFLREVDSA